MACLDLGIQGAGCLVKDKDGGVLEQDAGDGDALALAAGELHPALADMGVVARAALGVDEAGDEFVGMGLAGGGLDFGQRRIGHAVADVVDDRAVEEGGILGHHADRRRAAIPGPPAKCPGHRCGCAPFSRS